LKLYQLAYASRLYGWVEKFDVAYLEMRSALGNAADLSSQSQRDALFRFLNKWKCRIPERNFPTLKDALQNWATAWTGRLPEVTRDLCSLTRDECAQIGEAYASLIKLGAELNFQHTAIAKTLHALRPRSLPIWDEAIRTKFTLSRSLPKKQPRLIYSEFLHHVADEISGLERDVQRLRNTRLVPESADVRDLVNRPRDATLVKLVDEYYWITVTLGHSIPPLQRWARWIPENDV
jgi:hypothetical protein